jgi:hypothetical protein
MSQFVDEQAMKFDGDTVGPDLFCPVFKPLFALDARGKGKLPIPITCHITKSQFAFAEPR